MKPYSLIPISFLLLINLSCSNLEQTNNNLKVEELKETEINSSTLLVPWLNSLSLIDTLKPTFVINSEKSALKASGWLIANIDGFMMKIIVKDDLHKNNRTGSAIWDGDALQISIDAMGDGVGDKPKNTLYLGKDDANIAFALTEQGPKLYAHYHGNRDLLGDKSKMKYNILRDEKKKTTTYLLNFLWNDFQTKCGISDVLGIAVQINDTDKGPTQERLFWDMGALGDIFPSLYNKCKLMQPADEFISILPYKSNIWAPDDKIKILIAANYKPAFSLSIKENNKPFVEKKFPATTELKLKRYQLSYSVKEIEKESEYNIQIKNDTDIIVQESFRSNFPGKIIDTLLSEIKSKEIIKKDTLTKQYLNTIYELINNTWNTALDEVQQDEQGALLCTQFSQNIHQQVNAIDNQFEDATKKGERVILCSFKSSKDNSLQYYKLSFPANYNPKTTYPLIVDLHGWGNQYLLSFAVSQFGTDEDNCCYKNNHEAFIIQPWGRGNEYYKGNAGQDIYDGINDIIKEFYIDENKIYLTGFSMGGYGTWAHALLNPDKWRAIAICAGASQKDNLFENLPLLAHTPTMIWHGNSDGGVSVEKAYKMEKMLLKVGNKPYMKIIDGRGHDFRASDRDEVYQWLLSK